MFQVVSPFTPQGDQPEAIEKLSEGVLRGDKLQVLLGVTGSGKTYTMAKVIEKVQKPTLVLAHNKTLAAQLCSELKGFFPDSAVEYFVSYYDYYQPEAYIASSDTYIEKTTAVNEEIDRAKGRDHRGVGELHLRPGRPGGVSAPVPLPAARHGGEPGGGHAQARGHPVPAERSRLPTGHLPGPGRHPGHLPHGERGPGHPGQLLRGRPSASASSGTRSSASPRSTPSPARS